MHAKPWSIEEHNRLLELLEQGLKPFEIARILKRKAVSVRSRIRNDKKGFSVVKTWDKNLDKRLVELYNTGISRKEIARILERSYRNIVRRIREYELEGRIERKDTFPLG